MKNIISILLIIAAIALFMVFTNPRFAQVQALSDEVAQFDSALDRSKELISLRDALLSRYNAIPTENIERISTMLPDSIDTVRLIIDIDALASRYGMSLANISIGTPDDAQPTKGIGPSGDAFGRLTLSFTVASTYDRFRAFLNDLEHSLRIIDVTAIAFGTATDAGITPYTLTLTTYWLK